MLDGGLARRDRLVRILITQLGKVEADPLGDLDAALDGARELREQARHLLRRLEVSFSVGGQAQARLGDGTTRADTGQHVLQRPSFRAVVEDVIGRHHRRVGRLRQARQPRQTGKVARAIAPRSRQPDVRQGAGDLAKLGLEPFVQAIRRRDQRELAFGVIQIVRPVKLAVALPGAALAHREQAGEPAISLAVRRIDQEARRCVRKVQATAGEGADLGAAFTLLAHLRPPPHDAGQAVAVADPHGFHAQGVRPGHQLPRMRGAAQEREVAGGLQLGVAGHVRSVNGL